MNDMNLGLYAKYRVERINDLENKHTFCPVFVLDPQHDPIAVEALTCYAREARDKGYVALAEDLEKWVEKCSD